MNISKFKKAGYKPSSNSYYNAQLSGDESYYSFDDAVHKLVSKHKNERMYGIELEAPIDGYFTEDSANKLDELCVLRKDDCSLRACDVEFNLPPLTASYIRRSKIIDRIGNIMRQYGDPTERIYEDEDYDDSAVSYGIHIHSNRQWMTEQAARIVVAFINFNGAFFRWLAGRDGYSGYHGSTVTGSDIYITTFYWRHAACLTDKNTIEYRMFRSTYDQREVNVWMDCITAIEDWASQFTEQLVEDRRDSWGDTSHFIQGSNAAKLKVERFFEYVQANKRKYRLAYRAIQAFLSFPQMRVAINGGYVASDYDKCSLYAVIDRVHPKPRVKKEKSNANPQQATLALAA